MSKIEKIDKNFAVATDSTNSATVKYDVTKPPFSIHGVFAPTEQDAQFYRLPSAVATTVSPGVTSLSKHSAGGRIRFRTNSKYIAIEAKYGEIGRMPHFPLTGSAGFDLYADNEHLHTFVPPYDMNGKLFSEKTISGDITVDYTLNMPLYSEVKELYIILDKDAVVEAATPYANDKPIVFYGSSITQGGCASRPGTSYEAIVSRMLNLDYINLGFSGNALAEDEICDYINNLQMSAFVFDYDHNAPNTEHLRKTHEKFFKKIRKKHKDIPIICATMPIKSFYSTDIYERKEIIKTTVDNARNGGDSMVSYLDMHKFLEQNKVHEIASVDCVHPNDVGFLFMAEAITKELKKFY